MDVSLAARDVVWEAAGLPHSIFHPVAINL